MDDTRIDFLKTALQSGESMIQYIDTKVGIITGILGAYVVVVFSQLPKIITYRHYYSWQFWFVTVMLAVILLLSFWIVRKTVISAYNPREHILLGSKGLPRLMFFLGKNNYGNSLRAFCNSPKYTLDTSYEAYFNQIKSAEKDQIIESLAFELLKVNFIRNLKNDRLKDLTIFVCITSVWLLMCSLFFSLETQNAKAQKKQNIPQHQESS